MSPDAADSNPAGPAGTVQAAKPISALFPYLLGGLLHDVNNTLTILLCSVELGQSVSEKELMEMIKDLRFSARLKHVARVVQLMQHLARDYYAPAPRDRARPAGGVSELVARMQTTEPDLRIGCSFDPRLEGSELPDSLVMFLAGELLQNAARACRGGAGHRIELTIAAEPGDNTVSLCCVDDGPGFSTDQLATVRSGHVKPPEENAQGGYGLFFVNEIALRLQGRLLVSNRETGGARVEVLLPFQSPVRL